MSFCSDGHYECTYHRMYVPAIIGVLQKFGQSLDTPTLPFLPNL